MNTLSPPKERKKSRPTAYFCYADSLRKLAASADITDLNQVRAANYLLKLADYIESDYAVEKRRKALANKDAWLLKNGKPIPKKRRNLSKNKE